jgi:hypothetical protein
MLQSRQCHLFLHSPVEGRVLEDGQRLMLRLNVSSIVINPQQTATIEQLQDICGGVTIRSHPPKGSSIEERARSDHSHFHSQIARKRWQQSVVECCHVISVLSAT